MSDRSAYAAAPGVASSLREYGRGIVGGLLFSLPMLYTMEMWWAGFLATPLRLLAGLGATFAMLILYNLYAGLRRDAGAIEILIDSVEELGLALAAAASLLWLLDRINLSMAPLEIVGKIVVEGLIMAIGVSLGTAQLGGAGDNQGALAAHRDDEPWRHLALAACGAILFASNMAPTEEIVVLAAELPLSGLLVLAVISYVIGAIILHYSDFTASTSSREAGFVGVVHNTTQSYAVALVLSAGILWFFGRLDDLSMGAACAQMIVLGFAAMLGASAGRLLLQPA